MKYLHPPVHRRPAADHVALGDVRIVPTYASYDLNALIAASKNSTAGWNPSKSQGASPVIRLLLEQSGLAHTISSEIYNDADPHGHHGGNALDVTGHTMPAVTDFLKSVAPLFSFVAYQSSVKGASVLIWDGHLITTPSTIPGAVDFLAQCTDHVHIASSRSRMLTAMTSNAGVRNLLRSTSTQSGSGWIIGAPHDLGAPPFYGNTATAQATAQQARRW